MRNSVVASSYAVLLYFLLFDKPAVLFLLVTARRLEKEVKQVLDEISYDQGAKERLIRGRQVDLAEELSK